MTTSLVVPAPVLATVLAVMFFLGGCSWTKEVLRTKEGRLIVSGELLKTTGEQFLQTYHNFENLKNSGGISVEDYNSWISFARRFQSAIRLAIVVWHGNNDDQDAISVILSLHGQLLQFYLQSLEMIGGDSYGNKDNSRYDSSDRCDSWRGCTPYQESHGRAGGHLGAEGVSSEVGTGVERDLDEDSVASARVHATRLRGTLSAWWSSTPADPGRGLESGFWWLKWAEIRWDVGDLVANVTAVFGPAELIPTPLSRNYFNIGRAVACLAELQFDLEMPVRVHILEVADGVESERFAAAVSGCS